MDHRQPRGKTHARAESQTGTRADRLTWNVAFAGFNRNRQKPIDFNIDKPNMLI